MVGRLWAGLLLDDEIAEIIAFGSEEGVGIVKAMMHITAGCDR